MSIRIMLADDHAMFRDGLKELLENESDFEVVREVEDGYGVLQDCDPADVDVLLLDISMPGPSSTEVAEEILEEDEHFPILVLTMHEEDYYLREFLEIGVRGYLTKKSAGEHVIEAVRRVHDGKRYVDPELAGNLMDAPSSRPSGDEESRLEQLTSRQTEVCEYLALGHTNKEVAEKLGISPRTVESHRSEIMSKLGFDSRADLVRFALDHGLIGQD
jgi:DNA-binding NarL/FixJ family response regulator